MNTALMRKAALSGEQLVLLTSEVEKRKPSTAVAWLLWFFLGGVGAHKFYLKQTGQGVAMIFTLGGMGFWALFSAFSINKRIRELTDQVELDVMEQMKLLGKM